MDGAERWRILRLHVEDEIPLAELARDTKVSLRTLERWHPLFQEGGIAALDPRPRVDAGTRRTEAETVAFIERLALTSRALALRHCTGWRAPTPDTGTPRRQAIQPSGTSLRPRTPGLVTLALEGPASYRDRHELVYRRRAERPNQIWQADHTELDILIIGSNGKPDRPWLTAVMDDYSRAICGYTVFTGTEVLCRPRELMAEIHRSQVRIASCIDGHLHRNDPTTPRIMNDITKLVELLIIDEAERLTPTALELLRDNYDRTHLGIILIAMPGIDQRFRHYPQLYSRLGFSHRYRPLGRDKLLFVLDRHWKRLGRSLDPDDFTDAQAIAAIERITRGNFRLLERLFPQITRVLKINQLETITDDVIEAAASTLVIGN